MNKELPFEGVKVVEWSQAINGPFASTCLADFGAEVLKIESTRNPDMARTTVPYKDNIPGFDRAYRFLDYNTSKKSFTLDMKQIRGQDIFKKLVKWADIVLQNHRPGLMKEMSLGYEDLKEIKEDIILLDVSIVGQEGPLVGVGGWAINSMAQSGLLFSSRFPGGKPLVPGYTGVTDIIGALFVALAGIAALDYKRRTGKGQYLDICQLEPTVHFLASAVLDFTANGKKQEPIGNRHPYAAPHNTFQCKGDDRWCVIAVFTGEEWKAFCKVLGDPEWTKSPKFSTLEDRKRNEDELEKLVNKWTMRYTPNEVMNMMQEAGIPAGVVQNAQDIVDSDPQVKARELLLKLHHPVIGEFLHTRWPFLLSRTPGVIRTAPCIGQDNFYVCREILGMSEEEFIDLINSEVII